MTLCMVIKCHYAECRIAYCYEEYHMLSVGMLSVVMLIVVVPEFKTNQNCAVTIKYCEFIGHQMSQVKR